MLNNVEGATRGSVSVASMRVIWNVQCDRRVNRETPVMKSEKRQFVSPFDDTNHFEESAFIMKFWDLV